MVSAGHGSETVYNDDVLHAFKLHRKHVKYVWKCQMLYCLVYEQLMIEITILRFHRVMKNISLV